MADEPNRTAPVVTENISASASANAPFVFFDNVSFYGLASGIGQITLEAGTATRTSPDGKVAVDRVVVAHLRCSLAAIKSLRDAADRILAMAEPRPDGPAN